MNTMRGYLTIAYLECCANADLFSKDLNLNFTLSKKTKTKILNHHSE